MIEQTNIKKELEELKQRPASHWEELGKKMALDLFHYTVEHVPAYKNFLLKSGFDAGTVKSIEDFRKIPVITKDSYVRNYQYLDLFPDRNIFTATTISATSGSTGEPFFFPRDERHDKQYERTAETFLVNQFEIDKKKTLGIIGFALGVWIGGIFTYKNFNAISKKGYNLTLIPVGTNKDLFLKSFKKFAPLYDQIILMGYPPFIKDVVDAGEEEGISWSEYNLRILTAAEGYSEKFRNYVARKYGIKNIVADIINMYGTVEQGTMANESSLGNLIRKIATQNKKVFRGLFPKATNIPTLAQYDPRDIYIEADNGEIIVTRNGSSIPLVRYKFSDLGGVVGFDEMLQKLTELRVDIKEEAKKYGITEQILRLPFVYIYARADSMVVFRGANIYADEIKSILDEEKFDKILTGRFVLAKKEDNFLNQVLEISVELKNKAVPENTEEIENLVCEEVIKQLRENNLEYNNEYISDSGKTRPKIILCARDDQRYFTRTGKQKWVRKT